MYPNLTRLPHKILGAILGSLGNHRQYAMLFVWIAQAIQNGCQDLVKLPFEILVIIYSHYQNETEADESRVERGCLKERMKGEER